jgi:hypothetical protein
LEKDLTQWEHSLVLCKLQNSRTDEWLQEPLIRRLCVGNPWTSKARVSATSRSVSQIICREKSGFCWWWHYCCKYSLFLYIHNITDWQIS